LDGNRVAVGSGDADRREPRLQSGLCHVQGRFLIGRARTTLRSGGSETRSAPAADPAARGVNYSFLEHPPGGLCGRAWPGSRLESALERAFSVAWGSPVSRVFDPYPARLCLYVYKSPFAVTPKPARRAESEHEAARVYGKQKGVCGKRNRRFGRFTARISRLRQATFSGPRGSASGPSSPGALGESVGFSALRHSGRCSRERRT
jgi:hypothetical protein